MKLCPSQSLRKLPSMEMDPGAQKVGGWPGTLEDLHEAITEVIAWIGELDIQL